MQDTLALALPLGQARAMIRHLVYNPLALTRDLSQYLPNMFQPIKNIEFTAGKCGNYVI